ncbi:hypothetical protein P7C71_g4115, partial [Lecanoromycetidae sp. Uapishka_2]
MLCPDLKFFLSVFAFLASATGLVVPIVHRDVAVTHPSIKVINKSGANICYVVEISNGNIPGAKNCPGGMIGHLVEKNRFLVLHPSDKFNGAITGWSTDGKKVRGARHELNFLDPRTPGVWYDVDHEFAMSDSTLGPADGRPRIVLGRKTNSLAGEKDCLAKANGAWTKLVKEAKDELLKHPNYVKADGRGKLVHVRMDQKAPWVVRDFFQRRAEFNAYETHGSVQGQKPSGLDSLADQQTYFLNTADMVLTAY